MRAVHSAPDEEPECATDTHDTDHGMECAGHEDIQQGLDETFSRHSPGVFQKVKSFPRRGALKLLWVYQMGISPLKPAPTCRFEPVCSAYAIDAVTEYGAIRGTLMAAIRLTKCGPWHPGGWDPVRPRRKNREDAVDT